MNNACGYTKKVENKVFAWNFNDENVPKVIHKVILIERI